MRRIRGSVAHLCEKFARIFSTHLTHIKIVGDTFGLGITLLELLLTLLLINSSHESQPLLVCITNRGSPLEQLRCALRFYDITDNLRHSLLRIEPLVLLAYLEILVVRHVCELVRPDYHLEEAVLVPLVVFELAFPKAGVHKWGVIGELVAGDRAINVWSFALHPAVIKIYF